MASPFPSTLKTFPKLFTLYKLATKFSKSESSDSENFSGVTKTELPWIYRLLASLSKSSCARFPPHPASVCRKPPNSHREAARHRQFVKCESFPSSFFPIRVSTFCFSIFWQFFFFKKKISISFPYRTLWLQMRSEHSIQMGSLFRTGQDALVRNAAIAAGNQSDQS